MSQHPSWILLQSMIANGFYNLDSQRFRKASLDTRSEGWTETWGGKEQQNTENQTVDTTTTTTTTTESKQNKSYTVNPQQHQKRHHSLVFEDTTHSMWVEVDDPSISIVLTQYRPAWLEQIVLKMAEIKFIVVNSTYHCHEATGPLPFLRDEEDSTSKMILVGRHHPTNLQWNSEPADETNSASCGIYDNAILTYLQHQRNIDLDAHLTEPQKGQAHAFLQLIQNELQPILLFLRYEDDDAWEQVYRRQYIQASCPKGNTKSNHSDIGWILQMRGRFQARTERLVERRKLLEFTRRNTTVEQAVERARNAYQALERQLVVAVQSKQTTTLLLKTDRPALVDAALWAHLADALGDVHLVVVLASFPNLMQYFQDLYHQYFGIKSHKPKTTIRWEAWNERQNLENAFQQIPILSKNQLMKHGNFKDAIDLMQNLSLQKQELNEVLAAVKAKRNEEPWPKPRKSNESLLYRWSMGEDIIEKSTQTPEKEENPLRKKLLRDQQRNDQKWISAVAGVSVVAILLLQAGASTSE
ncbi:outer mitochondrial membrane transport complex protein [Nitzschia inconspicua]|uniref:Outer mitochondrial membrane transport complex protein n=1 Tax=Nitzschia inconspicua TaxID=303405 RepID=A0A9K3L603_9STRA|nr:outer mitochondrial membrane transport complex protein [Nitzschia inconspicua]